MPREVHPPPGVQQTKPRSPALGAALAAVLVAAGVAGLVVVLRSPTAPTPESQRVPRLDMEAAGPFDYAAFARVLEERVDERGMVDYAGIKAAPEGLDAFLREIGQYSPDRDLAMFTREQEALAYWINAYNAWMIHIVVDSYPVESVREIGGNPGAVFQEKQCVCGGEELSLDDIETGILRTRFLDPRIHFALNSASMGSPPLPRQPFLPEGLDDRLDAAARGFFARPRFCHLADSGRTVEVSSILESYNEDFLWWLGQHRRPRQIGAFIALYAPEEVRAAIEHGAKVRFIQYDWRLNDQAAPWAKADRP
jgi:hypothetical protein